MFSPSNFLEKSLKAQPRDMYDVIGALIGYINADPKFRTNDFEDAIKYVLSNGVSEKQLYSEFDKEKPFVDDDLKWDEEYYSMALVYLNDNFCRKRIEHVKRIAKKLYPASVTTTKPSSYQATAINKSSYERGEQANRKKSQSQQSMKVSKTQNALTPILVVLLALVLIVLIIVILHIV